MTSREVITAPPELATLDLAAAVTAWLNRLEVAWRGGDAGAIDDLFAVDSHWRDSLALTGTIQTVSGAATIARTLRGISPSGLKFHIAQNRTAPRVVKRAGVVVIEAIFAFTSNSGPASGVLRLIFADQKEPVAWVWYTALDGLDTTVVTNHRELVPQRSFGGPSWAERRREHLRYEGRDPTAVVVGAGHAGLSAAACLAHLGVDTLVIDRLPEVGDVWRNRYDCLVLHNETHLDHLPYLPFPAATPRFMPRDVVADWLRVYATALNLNVWTGTELIGATPSTDGPGAWTVVVRLGAHERVLHPEHLVIATGTNATPVRPSEPGLAEFAGTVLHSSEYRSGRRYVGKRAVVLGTGSSAHDIAQDLYEYGAKVTIVQRSPTVVISLAEAQKIYQIHGEGLPLADSDLLAAATPYPVLIQANQIHAAAARAADHQLLQGLAARGFRLDDGAPDATGFHLKLLRRGGGYYVNVGCSDLIAAGDIDLIQHDQIDRIVADGVRIGSGKVLPADLIVAATGYLHQHDFVEQYLGVEVAQRVGQVGGFDDQGELQNLWRRTNQPGLWFTGGGFPQTRRNSQLLALQIALMERADGVQTI